MSFSRNIWKKLSSDGIEWALHLIFQKGVDYAHHKIAKCKAPTNLLTLDALFASWKALRMKRHFA